MTTGDDRENKIDTEAKFLIYTLFVIFTLELHILYKKFNVKTLNKIKIR